MSEYTMTMFNPIFPKVHPNGTSREHLIEQQKYIVQAANDLIKVLAETMPHDRDYYPLPNFPKVGEDARKMQRMKMEIVEAIKKAAEATALQILQEQGK